jgi:hypothetical protein
MELDGLTDVTVDEQKDKLQNLSKEELEELREQEERQTAIDNIDKELSKRRTQEDEEQAEPQTEVVDEEQEHPQTETNTSEPVEEDGERSVLEAKVDYLIEKCKTTSHKDFEDYYED